MVLAKLRSLVPERVKERLRKFVWMRLNPSWELKSGIVIRVLNYNDWMIYNDIFVEGEYDHAIEHLFGNAREIPGPVRILDLGGNVGFFTLRLADTFLKRGRRDFSVVTVEGSPSTFAELRQRLAANGALLDERVHAIHGLAGARVGEGEIAESAAHGENTLFGAARNRKRVAFVDLDNLVAAWQRIDLLKCDIEGAEEMFMRNFPALLSKTGSVVCEFHHDLCDVGECRRLLAIAGLRETLVIREFGRCSVEFFWRAETQSASSET